jgi:hypothetical protein
MRKLAQIQESGFLEGLTQAEGGSISILAADYAAALCGLDTDTHKVQVKQLHAMQRSGLSREPQLALRDLADKQGPLALALIHQFYDLEWVRKEKAEKGEQGNDKAANWAPSKQRAALISALAQMPEGTVEALKNAAHSPHQLKEQCDLIFNQFTSSLSDSARVTKRQHLRAALSRLQGQDYTPGTLSDANAPSAAVALQWLQQRALND